MLEVETEASGQVREARILAAEPEGLFDATALAIARGSRLSPAYRDGLPIAATALLTLRFDPARATCPGIRGPDRDSPAGKRPPPRVTRHDERPAAASNGGPPCPGMPPSRYHDAFAAPGGPGHPLEFPMKLVPFATLAALAALPAAADEGMWTFDNPPPPRSSRSTG